LSAKMLPAPSAADCLYADLGIDPAQPGIIQYEATNFLIRKRTILTDLHVILWQVGVVGEVGFNRNGYEQGGNFRILVEKLQEIYPDPNYEITHYIAAQHAVAEPLIQRHTLSDLLKPEVMKTITACSTFYLPPHTKKLIDEGMLHELGLKIDNIAETRREEDDCKALETFQVPKNYHDYKDSRRPSSQFADDMAELAENPELVKKVKAAGMRNVFQDSDLNKIAIADNYQAFVLIISGHGDARMVSGRKEEL